MPDQHGHRLRQRLLSPHRMLHALPLHAPIEIRTDETDGDGKPQYRETTAGRLFFENAGDA